MKMGIEPQSVLALSPMQIYPPIFGGEKRSFYLLNGFLRTGFDVCAISDELASSEWHLGRPVIHRVDRYTEYRHYNPSMLFLRKLVREQMRCSALFKMIKGRWLNDAPPSFALENGAAANVLVLDEPFNLPLLRAIRQARHTVIHFSHNIEWELAAGLLDEAQKFSPDETREIVGALFQLEKAAFCEADLSFVCSEEDRDSAVKAFGVEPHRVLIAPNGADVDEFTPSSESRKREIKASLGIPGDCVVAFFVGKRYAPNHTAGLRVIETARALAHRPDILFVIGGTVAETLARELPAPMPNIRFASESEIKQSFQCADIGLNPMESGGGTNVKLFEFMASGLAVLTTQAGARGVPRPPRDAFVVAEVGSFARELCVLANEPELRRRLGRRARKVAEEFYGWKKIGDSMVRAVLAARAVSNAR
jgi:glycosyltransferase involved in cell wall biosynthesis